MASLGLTSFVTALAASGPFWSAIVPLVSSGSKAAIDSVAEWRRERARKRYDATFDILSQSHAALFRKIKDSFALIEACDEVVRAHYRQRSSPWRWLMVLIFMGITAPSLEGAGGPLAGPGMRDLPSADMLDPLIAVIGGLLSPLLGGWIAKFIPGSRIEETEYSDTEVDPLRYYQTVRGTAQKKLIMSLSDEIVTEAEVTNEVKKLRSLPVRWSNPRTWRNPFSRS